jgi:hypothetical protein
MEAAQRNVTSKMQPHQHHSVRYVGMLKKTLALATPIPMSKKRHGANVYRNELSRPPKIGQHGKLAIASKVGNERTTIMPARMQTLVSQQGLGDKL